MTPHTLEEQKALLTALQAAYVLALQLPHGSQARLRGQRDLCLIRDTLAEATGRSAQETQDDAEESALVASLALR